MPTTYPEGVYPGERPEKHVARLLTYSTFFCAIGRSSFMKGTHVVLGGEGGDVELLRSLHVPAKQIVVAEFEGDLCDKLRQSYPGVDIRQADVADVVRNLSRDSVRIASINLDFCGTLSVKTIEKAACVLSALKRPVVFSMTFSASREQEAHTRLAVVLLQQRLEESGFRSSFKGYEKPLSRAVLGLQRLQEVVEKKPSALRFLAYRANGASARGNQVTRSMSVVIGTTGPAAVPVRRYIAVNTIDDRIVLDEITCLAMQKHNSNNKEAFSWAPSRTPRI